MADDLSFIKLQPSSGIMKDKEDKTVGHAWIFRPDILTTDKHLFEILDGGDYSYMCVEVGSDNLPVNCIKVLRYPDQPHEWERVDDEEVLEQFKLCCKLLKKKARELDHLGDEIIGDMLSNNNGDNNE